MPRGILPACVVVLGIVVDRTQAASPHPSEDARLESVHRFASRVRTGDRAMMGFARRAAASCGTAVGMVSLLEEQDEWVVACHGTEAERIPRPLSFCAHTILEPDVLVVEDASKDPRFAANPYVVDEHHLRLYAGAPIFDAGGLPLGALCVADAQPASPSSRCLASLRTLAQAASAVLEIRLLIAEARMGGAPVDERRGARERLDVLLGRLADAFH